MALTEEEILLYKTILNYTPKFEIEKFCFGKQLDFILDKSPYKLALCSRRAGKTVACAVDLIRTSLAKPRQTSLYITLSRNNAKKIIWGDLLDINKTYNLGASTNDTELSMKFPNGSVIYLSGAKDKTEIEKFRGLALSLCYIDEAQSFKSYIQELVDDVVSKALFDHGGSLCLTGTPGPVPVGYFYDCYSSKTWSVHEWTMFDNPWIKIKSGMHPKELLDREIVRKGTSIDDPSIQREVFGKWVIDENSLVFRFDKNKNTFKDIPETAGRWSYIVGIDIGFDDSDAIAVLAYNEKIRCVYLVEEIVKSKQGISDLAYQVDKIISTYNPDSIVMDTGGLGKKIAEEMNHRFGLPIKPAEKVRKFEYIELLNDAMRTSSFKVRDKSIFADDCMKVEWDRDSTNLKISDKFHSDICDAVLYAFRESLHWLSAPDKPKLFPGSKEWNEEQEAFHLKEAEKLYIKSKSEEDFLADPSYHNDEEWL